MGRLENLRARWGRSAVGVGSSERTPASLAERIVNQATEVSIITTGFRGLKLKGKPSQIVFGGDDNVPQSMITDIQQDLAQKAAASYRETDSGDLLLVAYGRTFGIKGVVLSGRSAKAAFTIDGVPSALQTEFVDTLRENPYSIMSQVIDRVCGSATEQERLESVKAAFPRKRPYSTSSNCFVRVHQFVG